MTIENTPENIKKLRKKIGLTQTECGEIFGVGLSTWQKKEAKTHNQLNLSKGEFEYLLLKGRSASFSSKAFRVPAATKSPSSV